MLYSRFFVPTLREAPQDADNVSAKLMQRAGMIRKIASGIYEWLPLGMKVLKKVEQLVREEMNAAGGLEVWLPVIQPKELWSETGRWQVYGKELLRIKDRKGAEFCFAPTAEEVITDLVRREVRSWRQLPLMLYQFGTKFRDEIRPRFGVMRAREFYMKDAYSFDVDEKSTDETYKRVFEAYRKIFTRCGLKFRPVEAHSGAIGGSFSHEFMVIADTGEEVVVICNQCDYAANLERAEVKHHDRGRHAEASFKDPEEVHTPGQTTIEDVAKALRSPAAQFIKTMLYVTDGTPVMVLVRGDHEINEQKLIRHLGSNILEKATDDEYRAATGSEVGYAGPQGQDGKLKVIADFSIQTVVNGISGANKKDYHVRNLNLDRDYKVEGFYDLRKMINQDPCPRCNGKVTFTKGIEVGHTFKLGTKYSEKLEAVYLDADQKKNTIVMGCYGIGVSRVVAAAIEQNHDDNGIQWPLPLAPFTVVVLPTDMADGKVSGAALEIYETLRKLGVDVLLDDRDERAGVKFKDADLLGIPLRVTIGAKALANGQVELKKRTEKDFRLVGLADAVAEVQKALAA